MRRMSFITVVGSCGAKNTRFQGFLFGKAIFSVTSKLLIYKFLS